MNKISFKEKIGSVQPLFLVGFIILISLFGGFRIASASVLEKAPNNLGLVGYWPLEDATSTVATDHSGNGNPGTVSVGTSTLAWVDGKKGNAFEFDGADDYINMTDGDKLDFEGASENFTVSAWIKPSSINNFQEIVYKADANDDFWRMVLWNDNKITCSLDAIDFSSATVITADTWWHTVCVFDKSANGTAYINGESSGTPVALNGEVLSIADQNIRIGYSTIAGDTFNFGGLIDEVRIYNRALSATEVANLYASGVSQIKISQSSLLTDGLVGMWDFNGLNLNSNSVVDVSGNGNTGTPVNNPGTARGIIGQAASFNGSNNYIDISNESNFDFTSDFSIATWVKLKALGSVRAFVSKGTGGRADFAYGLKYHSAVNKFRSSIKVLGQVNLDSTTTPELDVWYHVVVTRNLAAEKAKIYVNGLEENHEDFGGSINTNDYIVRIGRPETDEAYMHGLLDEVRVYNKTLSDADVLQLYTDSKGVHINTSQHNMLTVGLTGMWNFDGPYLTTTTATDVSGNNDGTLLNGPVPARGIIGQALSFIGNEQYVDTNYAPTYITSAYSICGWMKHADDSTDQALYGDSASANHIIQLWRDEYASGDRYCMAQYNGGFTVACGTQSPDTSSWYYVCGTYDGTNMRLYVNGAIDGSPTADVLAANPTEIWIGGIGGTAVSKEMNGEIDEVRIYDRALSTTEIDQLYKQGVR